MIELAAWRFELAALELASYDPACDGDGRVAAAGAEIVRVTAQRTRRY